MVVANSTFILTSLIITIIAATAVGLGVWYLKPDTAAGAKAGGDSDDNSINQNGGGRIPDDFLEGLIISKRTNIVAFDPYSNTSITLADVNFPSVLDFDFYLNRTIYYSLFLNNNPIISLSKDYPNFKPPINDWYAKNVVVDYRGKNVYVFDDNAHKIYFFDMQSKYYGIILSDLDNVIDIALDPLRRRMFILRDSSILMAQMDGTELEEIIRDTNMISFTIDIDSGKLFWSKANVIMSFDYTSRERLNVASTTNSIISMAVLDKRLYFVIERSAQPHNKLFQCTMAKGICKDSVEEVAFDLPFKIKAYEWYRLHPADNPCKYYNGGCEHLCALSRNDRIYRCACNIGWELAADARSCSLIDEYVIYIRDYYVRGRIVDLTKETFVDAISPKKLDVDSLGTKKPVDFDFNARKAYLVFSDDYNIFRVDLTGMVRQKTLQNNLVFDMYPAIDWISDNLYYVAANRYNNNSYLMIRDNDGYSDFVKQKVIRSFPKEQRPRALVIYPNLGYLFITVYDKTTEKAGIYRLNSDGSGWTVFGDGNQAVSVNETGLGVDYITDRLYWFSEEKTKVQHAMLDGSDLKSFDISYVMDPISINIHRQWLYIGNRTAIWRVVKKTGEFPRRILPSRDQDNVRMMPAAKGYSVSLQPMDDNHPCAFDNGGCARYCFAVPADEGENSLQRVCACNDDEELTEDRRSCVYKPHGE